MRTKREQNGQKRWKERSATPTYGRKYYERHSKNRKLTKKKR